MWEDGGKRQVCTCQSIHFHVKLFHSVWNSVGYAGMNQGWPQRKPHTMVLFGVTIPSFPAYRSKSETRDWLEGRKVLGMLFEKRKDTRKTRNTLLEFAVTQSMTNALVLASSSSGRLIWGFMGQTALGRHCSLKSQLRMGGHKTEQPHAATIRRWLALRIRWLSSRPGPSS